MVVRMHFALLRVRNPRTRYEFPGLVVVKIILKAWSSSGFSRTEDLTAGLVWILEKLSTAGPP